jgi:hypothetical protein
LCACLYVAAAGATPPNILGHPKIPVASATNTHETPAPGNDELLATIIRARVSEPEQVANELKTMKLESALHLGRLDHEEWSEMMTGMRMSGVALGDRNKLRLLTEVEWEPRRWTPSVGGQGAPRAQDGQDGCEEAATNTQGSSSQASDSGFNGDCE